MKSSPIFFAFRVSPNALLLPAMQIEELIDDYTELEKEVHDRIATISGPACSRCVTPCCKPFHCNDVTESAWLRAVAERQGNIIPAPSDQEASFLTPKGCALKAGWPPQCTWYICDDLELALRDPLERYVYQVLTGALGHVIRNVKRDLDLTEVDDLNSLTGRQREKIKKRIDQSRRCCNLAWDLLKNAREKEQTRATAEQILQIARTFPFAARPVRFENETPSLSRSAREKNKHAKNTD